MALEQFDYIFAIAMIFAFLDAWNIGANDVANSFSTSVASRSLKYWHAAVLGCICEFLGAVLAGSRVTDTIKNKIIDPKDFDSNPAVLMLGMTCALVGSSIWLTLATKIGAPVSTTHSLVGAICGMGVAANGASSVSWGWSGFSKIIASWFIAPAITGGFSAILFLSTKYLVLERRHSLRNALFAVPCYFFVTFAILTMVIVWKGAPNLHLDDLSTGAVVGSIFGVAGVSVVMYCLFWLPYFYRKLVREDWTLKTWEILYGPLLFYRGEVPPRPEGVLLVRDYYRGNRSQEEEEEAIATGNAVRTGPATHDKEEENDCEKLSEGALSDTPSVPANLEGAEKFSYRAAIKRPTQWPLLLWKAFTHGVTIDVIAAQAEDKATGLSRFLGGPGIKAMHKKAPKYDIKTEHIYVFLQAMTACTASFSHGSNDVSNAAGPLSTVYQVWKYNTTGSKASVPVWVLAYTAGALCIGLWTYGYNIMRNLGNRLTLQSPSRGFSCELGSAITVCMATQLSLPISTTQCIVGGIVAVGLCNGDLGAVNWRMVAWIYAGWIFTTPCAGIIAGILMGIILNAPHWGGVYTLS